MILLIFFDIDHSFKFDSSLLFFISFFSTKFSTISQYFLLSFASVIFITRTAVDVSLALDPAVNIFTAPLGFMVMAIRLGGVITVIVCVLVVAMVKCSGGG